MEVFDSEDYKIFLRHQIQENKKVRGYQGKLAEAAGCQKSYFSLVVRSTADLNQEQALRLAMFWEFSSPESDWFLAIVDLARTQYEPLRKKIRVRLREILARRENLADASKRPRLSSAEQASSYYSAWYWSAIHILTGIPGYRRTEQIAERLSLSTQVVKDTLFKLKTLGLVTKQGSEWKIVPGGLHLPKDSILAPIHHSNWRQRAVADSLLTAQDSMHYTDVVSHTHDDFYKLKRLLLAAIEEWRAIVRPSKEEEISCLCLDFFRV